MRIVCISDTHGLLDRFTIPDGDVLIHAGDFTGMGHMTEIAVFNHQLENLPHEHKFVIAGNHDLLFQKSPSLARAMLGPHITYLEDRGVEVNGHFIYGSPWTPKFGSWAFMHGSKERMAEVWSRIPEQTSILITHGPPRGTLDYVTRNGGEYTGCTQLKERIDAGLLNLKLHVFGHIHEGYGVREGSRTKFVNASSLDGRYSPVNAPIIVDL